MRETGRSDAVDPFAEAKGKLFPPLRNRILTQAADALAANRPDIADALISKFLEKRPADPSALTLMADIRRRGGRFEEAEHLLAQCVEQSPECAGYRFSYALMLRRTGKLEQALAEVDKLLDEEPRNPLFRDQKAKVLRAMGRNADAVTYRRELAEEYPGSASLWLQYGDTLRGAGYRDECIAVYRKALDLAPSLAEAYLRLSDLKTYRFSATDMERMEAQLAVSGVSAEDRANLHFALGKAYGEQKLYAKSFDNYAKANALRRLNMDADPERMTVHRLNCQSLFTEVFFKDRTGWGCSSHAPIFIVGMPRSGSTLLEQILCSHSAIEGLGELPDLAAIVIRHLSDSEEEREHRQPVPDALFESKNKLLHAYPNVFARADAAEFRSMGEEYLKRMDDRRKLGRPYFTDKTLSNFGHVGLIHLMLPNAKIVDVRRHPLDSGWSCFKNHFPDGMPFTYKLNDIGHHYANYVRLMAHFDRVLPGRVHRVIYEDLIADAAGEVRRLFAYLELPFEEQCMRFHENKRTVATLSSEQVRMPLYQSGIAQWRSYEQWLGPLKSALGPVLDSYPSAPA